MPYNIHIVYSKPKGHIHGPYFQSVMDLKNRPPNTNIYRRETDSRSVTGVKKIADNRSMSNKCIHLS